MGKTRELFIFPGAVRRLPEVEEWLHGEPAESFAIARRWFARFRQCGEDVREVMHDGCPTACVHEAAFGYVNVYKAHVNVGFFTGAFVPDPESLLEGVGKRMRHVKLRPGQEVNSPALSELIENAYRDVKFRIQQE